jgi:hypothetical protein
MNNQKNMNPFQLFWESWKAFGHFLGNLIGRIAMTVFYFTVLVPFGLGVSLFSDPLQIKTSPAKLWRPRTTGDQTLNEISRQF